MTTGKVYWSVLQKERHGDFGGGTVQVIPHITNEIKSRFYRAKSPEENKIAIIEVGEQLVILKANRSWKQFVSFQLNVGHDNAILIHVTLIPYLKASEELKTKPTQASVKELQGMGIQPDVLVCRSEHELTEDIKEKNRFILQRTCITCTSEPGCGIPLRSTTRHGRRTSRFRCMRMPEA